VKIRIGVGVGLGGADTEVLTGLADDIVELGLDSLWLSEVLTAPGLDPLVGLAWAGAHNPKVKLGTTMLLPGRNLVRLAKELASLDVLSKGRLLVTFVPGIPRGPERDAIGVPPAERGEVMDEMLVVLRRLWAGETVDHHGRAGDFEGVAVLPRPVQDPLEAWSGGMVPSSLRRCGRFYDGWLPSMCSPEEAAAGKRVIDQAAEEAGRQISPEHFGVSVGYAHQPLDDRTAAALAARAKGRDVTELVPVGLPALRRLLEGYLDVGFSKFVVRPLAPPARWRDELELLADGVGDLQT
jgi:probable F420-dependent oxidoreductase